MRPACAWPAVLCEVCEYPEGSGGHRGSPSCSGARSHSFQGSVFPSSEPTTCCLVLNPTLSCVSSVLMTLSW